MAHLALRLLGPLEILVDGQPVTTIKLVKARALLAYLAAEADRAHPRATLAGLLWPDYAEPSALTSLRTALAMLRGALGDQGSEHPFLLIDRETVRLNPQGDHTADMALFDAIPMDRLASVSTASLQEAADLYHGEFLEGFALDDCPTFEEWVSAKRELYRRRAIGILHHLAERHLESRAYEAAEESARRIVALDPLDEEGQRQLMRALALGGRRAEALQQYEACAKVLKGELGIAPSAETAQLHESIRAGTLAEPAGAKPPEPVAAGPAAPPQAASLAMAPLLYQLPPPPADFTGRQEELRALTDAVQREGKAICGIRGPGGIGKTTLALVLAERLEEQYPDAQIFIEMRGAERQPLAPAEAMAQVIHAHYPLAPLPEGEQALRATYRSALHGRRAIILLDNARDRAQVEPLLPPPSCLLLITTRQHFVLPGLHAVDLEVQPLAQAAQLLRAIAPRLEEAEAENLAQACGRLPLALRVAGSALAEHEDLPAEEYLQRLRRGSQGLPQELEPVEASLGLSDALLGETLRQRWYTLSIFPDTFDRAGAQAVWGLPSATEAQDALSELLRYSLLEHHREARRYRLHDLTRAYAAARLGAEAAEEAGFRHAAHYAGAMRQAEQSCLQGGPGMLRGLALYDQERPNIAQGQGWAEERLEGVGEGWQAAARLCVAYAGSPGPEVWGLFHPRQRLAWCMAGLRAARRLGDRAAEAAGLVRLGYAHNALGDVRLEVESGEQALILYRELGERPGEAEALFVVSNGYYRQGEIRRAIGFAEQSLAIAEQLADKSTEVWALYELGQCYYALRNAPRAIEAHERGLKIVEQVDRPLLTAHLLWALGLDYYVLGDGRRASDCHERALTTFREIGALGAQALCLYGLGLACTLLGQAQRAVGHLEQALALHRELGDRHSIGFTLYALGLAYAAKGDDSQAIRQQEQALAVLREVGDRRGQAQALWAMSQARERLGERGQAMELAEEALALYEATEHPDAEVVRERLAQWRAVGL